MSGTKDSDDELARWREEWSSLGGASELAEELSRRVERDGKRLRWRVAREVLACLASTALSGWLLVQTRGDARTVVISAVVLVFNGVWITRLLTLHEGSLRVAAAGLDAFVELTRRRLADDLRWIAFGRRATEILVALVAPWSIWVLVSRWDRYRAEPWRAFVGFGVAIAIFAGVWTAARRRRARIERERARFEELVAGKTLS